MISFTAQRKKQTPERLFFISRLLPIAIKYIRLDCRFLRFCDWVLQKRNSLFFRYFFVIFSMFFRCFFDVVFGVFWCVFRRFNLFCHLVFSHSASKWSLSSCLKILICISSSRMMRSSSIFTLSLDKFKIVRS